MKYLPLCEVVRVFCAPECVAGGLWVSAAGVESNVKDEEADVPLIERHMSNARHETRTAGLFTPSGCTQLSGGLLQRTDCLAPCL